MLICVHDLLLHSEICRDLPLPLASKIRLYHLLLAFGKGVADVIFEAAAVLIKKPGVSRFDIAGMIRRLFVGKRFKSKLIDEDFCEISLFALHGRARHSVSLLASRILSRSLTVIENLRVVSSRISSSATLRS